MSDVTSISIIHFMYQILIHINAVKAVGKIFLFINTNVNYDYNIITVALKHTTTKKTYFIK